MAIKGHSILKTDLKAGEKIDMEIAGNSFRTELQELFPNGSFSLSHPMRKSNFIRLEPGHEVKIYYYRSDGLYAFEASVVRSYKQDDFRMILLTAVSEPYKHQRRQWYRLPISLSVKVQLPVQVSVPRPSLEQGGNPEEISRKASDEVKSAVENIAENIVEAVAGQEEEVFDTKTLDISVGGMFFVLPRSLSPSSLIRCSFRLSGDDEPLVLNGSVVRCIWPRTKGYPYRICIAFYDVSSLSQEKISKFILDQQRKKRSKR